MLALSNENKIITLNKKSGEPEYIALKWTKRGSLLLVNELNRLLFGEKILVSSIKRTVKNYPINVLLCQLTSVLCFELIINQTTRLVRTIS